MGFLTEHIKGEIMLLQASARREPWLASSIIRVIGEMVIAMEVATVIAERGPKTDASNGGPDRGRVGKSDGQRHYGAFCRTQTFL